MKLTKLTFFPFLLLLILLLSNCTIPVATGVATKAMTVSKSDRSIGEYVDDALIKVASDQQAIKPEQVVNLLKNRVQLGDDGKPEIIGDNNTPMYNDKGEPLSIKEYVGQFLDDNPHFKIASPSGAGSKSSVGGDTPKPLNLAELNMNNPEDKAKYMEYRKEKFKNY